jgi:gamma-glutamyltranspeptidase/glutathione hydrolase
MERTASHRPTESQNEITFTTRPVISGDRGVIAAGHYLAAEAGARIFDAGGNAVDAGVAAGFVLSLVKPHHNGMGGEAPMLIATAGRDGRAGDVVAISGQGPAPRGLSIEWCQAMGLKSLPGDGFLPATVPAAFGAWATALMRFGTMELETVLGPAIELAEEGFIVDPLLHTYLVRSHDRFIAEWPSSAECFCPGGQPLGAGERLRQPAWANTFKRLVSIARSERRAGREASIQAAIDGFYRGDVAEQLVAFQGAREILDANGVSHRGLLTVRDFSRYLTRVEAPVSLNYRDIEVFKCGPWTQGPVLLQQLSLLGAYDLPAMGHNSTEYVHLLVEVAKLAFADREEYYGDPLFVDVPLERLLSEAYAASRRLLIDPDRASGDLRPGAAREQDSVPEDAARVGFHVSPTHGDTTHLDAADAMGNMISATPSGGWFQASPVVPAVGFPLGTRAQQFSLEPGRPNSLAPGKRPRATLTPSIAFRNGRPWMAFGTPGGDYQDQWSLQFLLNVVEFGMGLQEALDAPTFHTDHFPSSFYPHIFHDRQVVLESRIDETVADALMGLGHNVVTTGPWANGQVTAVTMRRDGGVDGAASPRTLVPYVVGR